MPDMNENAETQQEYFGVHTDNTDVIANACKKIADLEKQIENMKCCGNCKHSIEEYGEFTCPFTKDNNFCSIAYNTENNSLWELKE